MLISEMLFLLLAAAFASLWIPEPRPRRTFSFGFLGAAGIPAIGLGALSLPALAWTGLLFVAGLHYRHRGTSVRRTARVVFLGLVLGLGFGLLPGFDAVTLHGPGILKSGSSEYALRIRPDKVIAGFALLAFAVPLTRDLPGWRRIVAVSLPALAVTAPAVLVTGWLTGYVGFEPQVPAGAFLAAWAAANLLFVTGIEEGFFRGIVQRGLGPRLGPAAAVATAALLFGLAHFAGGGLYVLLATLAGLGYGAAYHLAGQRIEAAMLTHFGLNLLHLLLFTYPQAA